MIIVVIIAVLLLALYDYLHAKNDWTLKSTWVKYVVAFLAGFFYVALSSLAIFKWILVAGVVYVAGIFWGVISQWAISLYKKYFKKTSTSAKA